jgi:hypothetical protein
MSQQAVREYDAKRMLFAFAEQAAHSSDAPLAALAKNVMGDGRHNVVAEVVLPRDASKDAVVLRHAWLGDANLHGGKLVAKPDQLVKRRGKHGLVLVGKSLDESMTWIQSKASSDTTIEGLTGRLDQLHRRAVCGAHRGRGRVLRLHPVSLRDRRRGPVLRGGRRGGRRRRRQGASACWSPPAPSRRSHAVSCAAADCKGVRGCEAYPGAGRRLPPCCCFLFYKDLHSRLLSRSTRWWSPDGRGYPCSTWPPRWMRRRDF